MSAYLNWVQVPVSKRLQWGVKHVYFTDHSYEELIIPEIKGNNRLSLKAYEEKFAYDSSHVASFILRSCIERGIEVHELSGLTPSDGTQARFYFYTGNGKERLRITTILRSGILFLNGDLFGQAYMRVPTERDYHQSLRWLKELGIILRPEEVRKLPFRN